MAHGITISQQAKRRIQGDKLRRRQISLTREQFLACEVISDRYGLEMAQVFRMLVSDALIARGIDPEWLQSQQSE